MLISGLSKDKLWNSTGDRALSHNYFVKAIKEALNHCRLFS